MLLVAYAIAVGNAGTGFRYRTHLISLAICLLVVVRQHRLGERPAPVEGPTAASVRALTTYRIPIPQTDHMTREQAGWPDFPA